MDSKNRFENGTSKMNRRSFLRSTGLAMGAGLAFPGLNSAAAPVPANPQGPDDWTDVRSQFPLEKGTIHMAMMLLASHPKPVKDAIERHRNRFDENPAAYWEDNFMTAEPKLQESAAAYLEADPGEIALTGSTTEGLGTLYTGFRLEEGDEILTTTHDHYSTVKSLEFAAQKNGANIRRVSLYDNPAETSVDEVVGRLAAGVRPSTRLVAVTWVHSSTGVKLPIREMADALAEFNSRRRPSDRIYLSVDGVHGFGIENVSMNELGCDFFVAGTHKWLFGPRGTGIIWAGRDAWDRIIPTIPPFSYSAYAQYLGIADQDEELSFADRLSPGGFHAFDHRWALSEAFDFHMTLGKENVERRTHQLSSRLKEGLGQMEHVTLHTPVSAELSSGINCFEVEGLTPEQVVEKLHEERIVASTSPYRVSYARLTPCIVNTEEEVDTCLRAIERLKA